MAERFRSALMPTRIDLHPGKVLTSMLKRVDVAVYNVMKSGKDGTFKPGIQELGLAEDGVGYAVDDNNKALITA